MTFLKFFTRPIQQLNQIFYFKIFLLFIAIGLASCTYKYPEQSFTIVDGNTTVVLTLGDSHLTKLYNFKVPQEIILKPPAGYKLIIGEQQKSSFSQTLQPQETLSLSFNILKNGDSIQKVKRIEQIIVSFKEDFKPKNQTNYMISNGKGQTRYGDNNFFTVAPNQSTVLVELHEYNVGTIHKFYYKQQKNDLLITLTPPTGHSFIFDKFPHKKYDFILKPHENIVFSMYLKPDWSNESYERIYHFISH